MLKKNQWCYIGVTFVSLCMFLVSCINDTHDVTAGLDVGDKVPTFITKACISDSLDWRYEDNATTYNISSSAFTGKVGIIVFFNTDCEDCQKELPEIQKVYDEIKEDNNFQLICIAREENADEIKSYWKDHNLTLPFSAQSDRTIYNLFASTIIPRIYITNMQGNISYVHSDSPLATSEQIKQEITALTK